MKKCSLCKNTKPLEAFSLDSRNKKTGRRARCKECISNATDVEYQCERNKKSYERDKERIRANRLKDPKRIAARIRGEVRIEKSLKARLVKALKIKLRIQVREEKEAIGRPIREQKAREIEALRCFAKWRKSIASEEWKNQWKLGCDRRSYNKCGRERDARNRRQWKIDNPELSKARARVRNDKREERLKGLHDGTVTDKAILRLKTERLLCPYCGVGLNNNIHLDHMQPVSLGGKHSIKNLMSCCDVCNIKKSNKPFDEWVSVLREPYRVIAKDEYNRKRVSC